MESHDKGSHEIDPLPSGEIVDKYIPFEADGLVVLKPPGHYPILVCVCLSHNCGFTGILRSSNVNNDTISLGNGTISK